MSRIISLLFVFAFLISAPLSQAHAEQTLAVVNIQKIMRDSAAATSARAQLKAKQDQFQAEITKKEAELKKEDEELAKQRSILAPDAFEQKVRAFREKASGVQRDAQMKQGQLTKAFNSALSEMQGTIVTIIGELAKEKGFAIAMPSTQTLYANPSLDITDEVLKRLNTRLTKITINFQ